MTVEPDIAPGTELSYVDLTIRDPPRQVDAYPAGAGTIIRVSGNCDMGATVGADPPNTAVISTVIPAKDGKAEAIRVVRAPNVAQVKLVVVGADGERRSLTLRYEPASTPATSG